MAVIVASGSLACQAVVSDSSSSSDKLLGFLPLHLSGASDSGRVAVIVAPKVAEWQL